MAKTVTTFPYQLVNGQVADATKFMANLNALKTSLETTKLADENLAAPYSLFALSGYYASLSASGSVVVLHFTAPAALVGVELQAAHGGSGSVLSATLVRTAGPLTVATLAGVADDGVLDIQDTFSYPLTSGATYTLTLSETGGAAAATDIQWSLWLKAKHVA